MRKVNSFDELKVLADELKPNLSLRKNYSKENVLRRELLVCCDTGCTSSNSLEIVSELENEIKKSGIQDKVSVRLTGCFGFCAQGPIVKVYPDNVFYVKVEPSDAEKIVQSHLIRNTVVEELLYEEESLSKKVEEQEEMSFYKKQLRIALKNCGLIDPDSIEEYIANDGYLALGKCLTSLTPQEVIAEVKTSGLVVEVVQVSLLALNGKLLQKIQLVQQIKSLLYVMLMKVTQVHLWIDLYLKVTLIVY
ncbi:Ferredoxin, 2Fe-2S [Clostridioides difficile]|nr:Ferredoxin, 2Fe-2S [Clostridioides difficile]